MWHLKRTTRRIFGEETRGKNMILSRRCTWKDNIEMGLIAVGFMLLGIDTSGSFCKRCNELTMFCLFCQ